MCQNPLSSVVLEVISDSQYGRQTWIGPNQVLTVGNSQTAEHVIDCDPYLAPVHFRISSDYRHCRISNATEAATWVNHEQVQSAVLYDGDVVTAGGTRFLVKLVGGESRPSAPVEQAPQVEASVTESAVPSLSLPSNISEMMGQLGLIA